LTLPKGYENTTAAGASTSGPLTSDETTQVLWQGLVRIDDTFDDFVSNISDTGTKSKVYDIVDIKYPHPEWNNADNHYYSGLNSINSIRVIVQDSKLEEYMYCNAFIRFALIPREKGLIKKERWTEKRPDLKGFFLQPVQVSGGDPKTMVLPTLASYRGNIGGDNAIHIQQSGVSCFYSGSCSANRWAPNPPARRSLTCVFVASDTQPFVAQVRKKGSISSVICKSSGFNEELQDRGKERPVKKGKNPLEILKLRLAKGEITMDQYNELRKVLESE
jgi:hypothetical protein